jgi:hypothetical protein
MSLWLILGLLAVIKLVVAALMMWLPFRDDFAMHVDAPVQAADDEGGSPATPAGPLDPRPQGPRGPFRPASPRPGSRARPTRRGASRPRRGSPGCAPSPTPARPRTRS